MINLHFKRMKKGYYSELIKSLCIIFLEIIFINKKRKSSSFIRKSFKSVKNVLNQGKNTENSNNIKIKNDNYTIGESKENNLLDYNDIFEYNNLIILKNFEFLTEISISKEVEFINE